VLPVMLNKLNQEELGFWYVMLALGGIVTFLHLGYGSMVQRSAAYFMAGAQQLVKFGLSERGKDNRPNYAGLKSLVQTMRIFYWAVALIAMISLLLIGTTWLESSILTPANTMEFLAIWYVYLIGGVIYIAGELWYQLLIGINEVRLTQTFFVISLFANYIITIAGLLLGFGLWSVVCGKIVEGLFVRGLGWHFFNKRIGPNLGHLKWCIDWELFCALWPNAWRISLLVIFGYLTVETKRLVTAEFFDLVVVASLGVSLQLARAIKQISSIWVSVKYPVFSQMRVNNDFQRLNQLLMQRLVLSATTFVMFSIGYILLGKLLLEMLNSNTQLLAQSMLVMICLTAFFEMISEVSYQIVLTENRNPFVPVSIITGVLVVSASLILVVPYGIWGILVASLLGQATFSFWYFPYKAWKGLCHT